MSDFLSMGGYAAFIWPAYGVTTVVMVALLVGSIIKARTSEAELELVQQTRRSRRSGSRQSISETESP